MTDLNGRPLFRKGKERGLGGGGGKGKVKWVDRDGPKWPASVRVREGMGFEVEITKNWLMRFFFFFINLKIGEKVEQERPRRTPYRGPTWFFRLLTTLWLSTTGCTTMRCSLRPLGHCLPQ